MTVSALPRVTVLMPVYNGGSFLSEAIQSILRQTYTDFELLVIDDGSNDGSADVIEGFQDVRIRLIRNGVNRGLVASLNLGFESAQGEYIARMDADDISRPERLFQQVRFMDKNPQVGVCGSWVQIFSQDKSEIWKLPGKHSEICCWQFHGVGVAHPSVMMRRQMFIGHGLFYDSRYRHIEDFELWGRALNYMQFANIQRVLLDYRMSTGQVCAVNRQEQLQAISPLRLQKIRELELEPAVDEFELHEMIMNGTIPPDPELFKQAENWLLYLDAANRITGRYAPGYFSEMLIDIWFSICIKSSAVIPMNACLGSPLWLRTPNSSLRRFRALAVWVMQGGKKESELKSSQTGSNNLSKSVTRRKASML